MPNRADCPTCGSRVEEVASREGTYHFKPLGAETFDRIEAALDGQESVLAEIRAEAGKGGRMWDPLAERLAESIVEVRDSLAASSLPASDNRTEQTNQEESDV